MECISREACLELLFPSGPTRCLWRTRRNTKHCITLRSRAPVIQKYLELFDTCKRLSLIIFPLIPDLLRRLQYPIKGSKFQELLLILTPFMIYSFCPSIAALFVLDPSDEQFLFSLLPAEMRGNMAWIAVGAALEFRFIQFVMSSAYFEVFHCITFVRVIQTCLAHSAESIR